MLSIVNKIVNLDSIWQQNSMHENVHRNLLYVRSEYIILTSWNSHLKMLEHTARHFANRQSFDLHWLSNASRFCSQLRPVHIKCDGRPARAQACELEQEVFSLSLWMGDTSRWVGLLTLGLLCTRSTGV